MKNVMFYSMLLTLELIIYYLLGILFGMPTGTSNKVLLIYAVVMIGGGQYKRRSNLIWEEVRTAYKSIISFCAIASIMVLDTMGILGVAKVVGISGVMLLLNTVINRGVRILFRNYFSYKTLVIGEGWKTERYLDVIKNNRFTLVDVVGVISPKQASNLDSKSITQGPYKKEVPLYGFDQIEMALANDKIDQIIVLIPIGERELREKVMKSIHGKAVQIKSLVGGGGLITFASKIQDYDGILLCSNSSATIGITGRMLKRCVDIAAGVVGCLITIPLYIKVRKNYRKNGDNGPVIFTQERIGRYGKPIKIYKFRTMVENAETILEELMESDPEIKEEYLTHKKLANDPRVTKLGDKLRRTSLDEFPQFWNVLKGEMSLVGPRPYLYREKEDMGIYYDAIVSSKPGITGMWQANGRSDVSFEERCRFDDYYNKNWSIMMEFVIIYKTVKGVVYGKGAM